MVEKIETWTLRIAPFIAGPMVLVALIGIFFWVPTDAALGISQRIFYFHVPCATTTFLAFAIAGISSAVFLKTGRTDWDHAAHAAVGTGMIFATLVLATGSIWARTAWGTWWTWDARLTTFLVLWLVFATYLLMRSLARDNDMAPRYAGVLAVVGAMNIPLVMMATRLWRTIHPQVIRNPDGGIEDTAMLVTLLLSMIAILSTFAWICALRLRLHRFEEKVLFLTADANSANRGSQST
jgi:heme exporter protein C